MFGLRTHAIICGVPFALQFGIPVLGNTLPATGVALPAMIQSGFFTPQPQ